MPSPSPILTGIQSTGTPHLGNLLGAMLPTIHLAHTHPQNQIFCFIADLHALTTIKDPEKRKTYIYTIAAAWLALGLDKQPNALLCRQSHIPAVTELAWYLSCLTPYARLTNAHAFKDKTQQGLPVSGGLFTYPILMAADVLLYQAGQVPVGKDQLQHLELTRDVAQTFNQQYGNTFVIPEAYIHRDVPTVLGIDGRKMSKSYQNTIDVFLPEAQLYQDIMRIQTDSTPLAAPKDPETCTVFALYRLVADAHQVEAMRAQYLAGGYGYAAAKKTLAAAILERFASARERFANYMSDFPALEQRLLEGEEKARAVATETLQDVRTKLGYERALRSG
ncbi:MAG: tryptophan--tRNA ligase [Bacteroidota bacterium]